eukprot:gnl/TRDRNA2_/TRDRNA2_84186_c0_seq1.p1 gnl/TRDRNA2_/TRDRNA2_84186_c0~~gnl/TRDRNA2_/TRDRNA2_84186_c0_seq1.p1  ORF type:complete len:807 (-),score=162.00 gnl/TRDRNA2_/TRDRNA2_84186_c0_seq1:53-2473(-)
MARPSYHSAKTFDTAAKDNALHHQPHFGHGSHRKSIEKIVEGQDGSHSIRAVVRVRPIMPKEIAQGDETCVEIFDENSLGIRRGAGEEMKRYYFDCVLNTASQKQVFKDCGVISLLDEALDGYNCTILTYGQTGSGKTFTMVGRMGATITGGVGDKADGDEKGLILRTAKRLFKLIADNQDEDMSYSVSASWLEVFNAPGSVNECIGDLLNPVTGNLQVRHNKKHGFFVEDLCVIDCQSAEDVFAVVEAGIANRRVGQTEMNKDSSRSHALFTLYVDSTVASPEGTEGNTEVAKKKSEKMKRYGKITFVDLAGSERLKESKVKGNTAKESQAINKSLFTLGQVISTLSQGKASAFVPYRNSKLTQLLQESFGGQSHCMMITCISPNEHHAEESINSLIYASKAMNIKNTPVCNMDERSREVQDLRAENEKLRSVLQMYQQRFGSLPDVELVLPRGTADAEAADNRSQLREEVRRELMEEVREELKDELQAAGQPASGRAPNSSQARLQPGQSRASIRGDEANKGPARTMSEPPRQAPPRGALGAPAPAPLPRVPSPAPEANGSYAASALKRRASMGTVLKQQAPAQRSARDGSKNYPPPRLPPLANRGEAGADLADGVHPPEMSPRKVPVHELLSAETQKPTKVMRQLTKMNIELLDAMPREDWQFEFNTQPLEAATGRPGRQQGSSHRSTSGESYGSSSGTGDSSLTDSLDRVKPQFSGRADSQGAGWQPVDHSSASSPKRGSRESRPRVQGAGTRELVGADPENMTLAELNQKLSSMQVATSALLRETGPGQPMSKVIQSQALR